MFEKEPQGAPQESLTLAPGPCAAGYCLSSNAAAVLAGGTAERGAGAGAPGGRRGLFRVGKPRPAHPPARERSVEAYQPPGRAATRPRASGARRELTGGGAGLAGGRPSRRRQWAGPRRRATAAASGSDDSAPEARAGRRAGGSRRLPGRPGERGWGAWRRAGGRLPSSGPGLSGAPRRRPALGLFSQQSSARAGSWSPTDSQGRRGAASAGGVARTQTSHPRATRRVGGNSAQM